MAQDDRNDSIARTLLGQNDHGFFIALAIVVAALIGANALRDIKRAGDTIQVTGSARMRVTSDYVVWRGNLQASAPTSSSATRQIQQSREKFLAFLSKKQVADSLITMSPVNGWQEQEYDNNGRPTGRMLRYNANQQFEVRSSDVDLIVDVASAVEELMREGISLNSQSPEFLYTHLDEARISLMADATRDAKARAVQIAEAAGGKIGSIREARMGVIQVVAPNSTNISDYGMYDTSTREKDVVGVVKVSFAVK